MLNFLHQRYVPAHLLFIYFTGDTSGPGHICPQSAKEWNEILRVQKEHVGLPEQHSLSERVHSLLLPVMRGSHVGANPSQSPSDVSRSQ